MKTCQILLVGIGGYGSLYVNAMLNDKSGKYAFAGCVEPYPERCGQLEQLKERNVPIYDTMDAFYADGRSADLVVLSTPIHFHAPMILEALAHGANVLCEKPLCGDERLIEPLIAARDKAGKFVSIGYQWSHADAMLAVKRDILKGDFGKPQMLKTIVLWPRDHDYFKRGTGWGGQEIAKDGTLIRDSVANNATAHYLHNLFFMQGSRIDRAAMPDRINSMVYRHNAIGTFDTAIIETSFESGAKALYIASHAVEETRDPEFVYRFEGGTIYYNRNNGTNIRAMMSDGSLRDYGNPFAFDAAKLFIAADAAMEGRTDIPCPIECAAVETRVIAAVHDAHPAASILPAGEIAEIEKGGKVYTVCKGLGERLSALYAQA